MLDLSTVSIKILNILNNEECFDIGSAFTALDILGYFDKKFKQKEIDNNLINLHKQGFIRLDQVLGVVNFWITYKGIKALNESQFPEPTEQSLIGELMDISEKEKVLSGAMKSNNVDVIALVTEINQLKDELSLINAENSRLNAENINLLRKIETLKQSQPTALWIQEQDPTAEYAISSAYMQRRPSLEELLQRAEAETVKHAKPRTIYQIKKLGVMIPNVTAEFKTRGA